MKNIISSYMSFQKLWLACMLFILGLNSMYAQNKTMECNRATGEEVLTFAEQMPEYPTGFKEMEKFIKSHINYPKEAQENSVEGKVIVQFVVSKEGKLCNPVVLSKLKGFGLDEEAINVIKKMPDWRPGKQNGIVVAVQFTMPIVFSLKQ